MKCYTQPDNGSHSGVKTNVASAELIQNLEEIAKIKKGLPARSRGYCSELGLYVQMREAGGMARLQAGGKFRSRINLWRDSPTDFWQVKKYRTGDWESLVEPTLELAEWLEARGGVTSRVKGDFRYSIKGFRSTGELELPERLESFQDDSVLGCLLNSYPEVHGDWDDATAWRLEKELLEYLEANPRHAAAWQALMRMYDIRSRYKEALTALDKAISIAPFETDFFYEAALLYFTAIENAVETNPSRRITGNALTDCSLDALDSSYEEARATCIKYLTNVLESKRPDSKRYKQRVGQLLGWCMATPIQNPNESYEADEIPSYSTSMIPTDFEYKNATQSKFSFCEYLAFGSVKVVGTPGRGVDMDQAIRLTVLQLLLGMSMARRYPNKAKIELIKEPFPSPSDGVDIVRLQRHAASLRGLRGDDALLYAVEKGFESDLERWRGLGEDGGWILMHVLMRLTPVSSLGQGREVSEVGGDVLFESLFGAMRDGIAYILFLSSQSHLDEFERKLETLYTGSAELVDASLDASLEAYEKTHGVIQ